MGELAQFLRTLSADEIETAVNYLSGRYPGKIGVAHKATADGRSTEASGEERLSISDVDQALVAIAAIRGKGSAQHRTQGLQDLFSRATPAEQQFLLRLIVGELRQGALAWSHDRCRCCSRRGAGGAGAPSGDVFEKPGIVARTALLEGAQALARFQLELFVPASPMLAQTAADVAEALQELGGEVAFEWKMDGAAFRRTRYPTRCASTRVR